MIGQLTMEKEIQRIQETDITCPYCGYQYKDSWEHGINNDGDSTIIKCPECTNKFYVALAVRYLYTSKGLCKENGVEHNWHIFDFINLKGERIKGRSCLTCDKYEFDADLSKPNNQEHLAPVGANAP